MDGNVTSRILCPWCGAEMRGSFGQSRHDEWCAYGWYKCEKCKSTGPLVCGYKTVVDAERAGESATLRRYTPPAKPLEAEQLPRYYCLPCWIEKKGEKAYPDVLDRDSVGFFGKIDNVHTRTTRYLTYADYGRTWRCWERKPTEEERSAAEWITD